MTLKSLAIAALDFTKGAEQKTSSIK